VGPSIALDLVRTFLAAEFSQAERHLRRLAKVASLEAETDLKNRSEKGETHHQSRISEQRHCDAH